MFYYENNKLKSTKNVDKLDYSNVAEFVEVIKAEDKPYREYINPQTRQGILQMGGKTSVFTLKEPIKLSTGEILTGQMERRVDFAQTSEVGPAKVAESTIYTRTKQTPQGSKSEITEQFRKDYLEKIELEFGETTKGLPDLIVKTATEKKGVPIFEEGVVGTPKRILEYGPEKEVQEIVDVLTRRETAYPKIKTRLATSEEIYGTFGVEPVKPRGKPIEPKPKGKSVDDIFLENIRKLEKERIEFTEQRRREKLLEEERILRERSQLKKIPSEKKKKSYYREVTFESVFGTSGKTPQPPEYGQRQTTITPGEPSPGQGERFTQGQTILVNEFGPRAGGKRPTVGPVKIGEFGTIKVPVSAIEGGRITTKPGFAVFWSPSDKATVKILGTSLIPDLKTPSQLLTPSISEFVGITPKTSITPITDTAITPILQMDLITSQKLSRLPIIPTIGMVRPSTVPTKVPPGLGGLAGFPPSATRSGRYGRRGYGYLVTNPILDYAGMYFGRQARTSTRPFVLPINGAARTFGVQQFKQRPQAQQPNLADLFLGRKKKGKKGKAMDFRQKIASLI